MVAVTTLILGLVGLTTLWGLYSLVAFIAHWAAVLGGITVFYGVLQYLVEERPIELFELNDLNNLTYLLAALPLGFLSFRLLQSVFVGVGIVALLGLVAAVVVTAVLGPAQVLGWTISIIRIVSDGSE